MELLTNDEFGGSVRSLSFCGEDNLALVIGSSCRYIVSLKRAFWT